MRSVCARLIAVLALAGIVGCSASEEGNREPSRGDQPLRVAEQHGLAYLPLGIMQVEGYLEDVEWIRLGNASVIREAMLAGRLDVGFMGIPPYLIGRDNGTEWEVFTGLSEAPLGLVTLRDGYRSLRDLEPSDRIALPQPGSIQHILLAMAAERTFGDPRYFDDRLVSMGHPEGYTALVARSEVAAHFTAPPYLFSALDEAGATLLLDGVEAFGDRFTFIVGVGAPGWSSDESRRSQRDAFSRALDRAIEAARLVQDPVTDEERREADRLLDALALFYSIDREDLERQLRRPGMVYSREIHGLDTFVSSMIRFGYLTRR